LTHRLLQLRRDFPDLFARGDYQPVRVSGPHAKHVIAFTRSFKRQTLLIAVGRHYAPLTDGGRHWPSAIDARIDVPGATYRDVLGITSGETQNEIDLSVLFKNVGVGVLRRSPEIPRPSLSPTA
jgi:(1->4)-alpha-D-glucan 1-alpha-D-glucosylmutase